MLPASSSHVYSHQTPLLSQWMLHYYLPSTMVNTITIVSVELERKYAYIGTVVGKNSIIALISFHTLLLVELQHSSMQSTSQTHIEPDLLGNGSKVPWPITLSFFTVLCGDPIVASSVTVLDADLLPQLGSNSI